MWEKAAIRWGTFPILWAEWNGKYRDTVRRFWKGDEGTALGLCLSPHRVRATCIQHDGRKPYASINFITAHDGFTLCDPRQLQRESTTKPTATTTAMAKTTTIPGTWVWKDRPKIPPSMNCGSSQIKELPRDAAAEPGRTHDLRRRRIRPAPSTATTTATLPGQRTDLVRAGSSTDFARPADGVHAASWWKLRLTHPNLHRRKKFFQDRTIRNSVVRDIAWYGADGNEMPESSWTTGVERDPLGLMLERARRCRCRTTRAIRWRTTAS